MDECALDLEQKSPIMLGSLKMQPGNNDIPKIAANIDVEMGYGTS